MTHTSDYFPVFYAMALELIDKGKAYVCHQSSLFGDRGAVAVSRKARVALKAMQDPPAELVKEAKLDQPSAHESPYRKSNPWQKTMPCSRRCATARQRRASARYA